MPIFDTANLSEDVVLPFNDQLYNGLDCCVTQEVLSALRETHPESNPIYNFSRALQGPMLDMMRRGFLIDSVKRQKGIESLEKELLRLNSMLNKFSNAVWGKDLNANSPKQLQDIFYKAMGLPEIWTSKKGERKLSLDREALEKLDAYILARPLVATILAIRDTTKQLSVLRTDIDSDGRMRTSYNIGGTETGRLSSSTSASGTGCVLPSTQVLTKTGWKEIQYIADGDVIAQYNLDGSIEFVECKMHIEAFSGEMLRNKTEQIQQTLTPGHRVLHLDPRMVTTKVASAQEVSNLSQEAIPLGGKLLGKNSVPIFLAMLLADFSKEPSGWRGAFKKQRKIERFLQLCAEYKIEYTEQKDLREGYRKFYIPGFKDLPKTWGSWVLDLDLSTAEALLEEARHWDSHDRGSGFIFYSADKNQAEWFATLAHIAGKSATIRSMEQSPGSYSTSTIWCVNVKSRQHARVYKKHWKKVAYTGYVYCPQVPSSFWLMRENGFISVTGNTNLQNITAHLRDIFVADPGFKLVGIDLEQAESREVGWLSGTIFDDWTYLDACYSGDLHTLVAQTAWPELPWTSDAKKNRAIADTPFYRHLTYRDMSKKLGHGCLTEDHEVLTRNGWVPISSKPSEILAWNEEFSSFEQVSHWTDFYYTGELHSFEGNSISAKMTADHRVPYKSDKRCPLKERRACEGPGPNMPLGFGYIGGNIAPPARLIAAFMSDGHQHTANSMKFHFHKERKVKRLIELCKLYDFSYRIATPYIYVEGELPKEPGWWMLDWTEDALDEFLDEYKYWDGHVSKTAVGLFSKHRHHLEIIQTLGRIRGIGGSIQKPTISGFGTTMYKLQQNQRKWASGTSIEHLKEVGEETRVFCPTLPSTWFYVRRNGKIFVTGNSNYRGLPPTMARHAKIPVRVAETFQANYFGRFPGIPRWHRWVAQQIQTTGRITTPFGRSRDFFGRRTDDSTLREAIAFSPQSATGDRLNLILFLIWLNMPEIQLLAQVHDALYFQFPEHLDEEEVITKALSFFHLPMKHAKSGRELIVPGEAKVGWNWGNFDPDINPDGLKKWKGKKDERKRTPILLQKF